MLDPKLLRNDLDAVARNLARRGFVLDRARYQELETNRKDLQVPSILVPSFFCPASICVD